jgi:carbonic anhydrase/acetyltransferase-like protein (isoleucine patch superfamily)
VAVYAIGDVEPRIDPTAYVHPDAVVIGDVELGPGSSVWPMAVLRGDDAVIRIGARSNVQDGAVLHCSLDLPTIVGEDVTIGHQAHLEGCIIHDHSLIGVGAVVLHEAQVGPHALVGANAVVTNRMIVPANALALGVPAKIRENALEPEHNLENTDLYVTRGGIYRDQLRRID